MSFLKIFKQTKIPYILHFRCNFLSTGVMSSRLSPLQIVNPTNSKHSGTVIFFHGSGSTAEITRYGVADLFGKDFSFSQLKVIFPTAPLRPYTPLNGEFSNVWFDRYAITASVSEHLSTVEDIGETVKDLIKEENNLGIPNNRIVVGGISMGGALALYTGYNFVTNIKGVFAISSFLNKGSIVFNHLQLNTLPVPELLQFHGAEDDLVPLESGKETFEKLKALGVKGNFIIEKYADHGATKNEIKNVHSWIKSVLPDL